MQEQTYEQAMNRLNEITTALENGNLPLNDALQLYEEASALVRFCNTCLNTAEQKIVTLTQVEEESHDA